MPRDHPRPDFPWFAVLGGVLTFAALVLWPLRSEPRQACPASKTITVADGRDVSAGGQRHRILAGWHGPGGGYEARPVELSPVADEQHSQLLAWARSRSCAADVYLLDVQWVPEFARGGYIEPLAADANLGDILRNVHDTGRYGGKRWAIPFNTDAALLYYRTDLVKHPPATWQQLWDESARLLKAPPPGLTSAYAPQFAAYEGLTVNTLEMIWAAGGDVIDDRKRVVVDREPVRRLLRTLAETLRGTPPVISPAALGHTEADNIDDFQNGRVAFMRNWPYVYATLANNPRMKNPDGSLKFAVTSLPGPREGVPGRSVLGGQSLAIAAHSPNKAAARDLIHYLIGDGAQSRLFACGGFAPVLRHVYLNPGQCPDDAAKPPYKRVVHRLSDPYVRTLLNAVETARARPPWPYYTEVSRVLRQGLHECLSGNVPCGTPGDIAAFTERLAEDLEVAMRGR